MRESRGVGAYGPQDGRPITNGTHRSGTGPYVRWDAEMTEGEEVRRVGDSGLGAGICLRQSEERLYESPGVGRCGCHFGGIQAGQDFEAVLTFVIAAFGGVPGGPVETVFDSILGDPFDLPGIARQRIWPEPLPVEVS